MLDSGADVSLITSQLANSLRAKRIPCPTRVIGINNAGHLVEVTLTSLLGTTRESVTIQALVVQTSRRPMDQLSEVLTDPSYKENSWLTGVRKTELMFLLVPEIYLSATMT